MKISKVLLLLVSIGFIVFGSVFIAYGFQTTTDHITPSSAGKQDQSAANKTSHSNERASIAKHASVPKQKVHKKGDNSSSSVSEKLNTSASDRSDSNSNASMSSSSSSNSGSSSGNSESDTNSTSEQKADSKASGSSAKQSSTSNDADNSNQALIHVEIKGYDNKDISGSVEFTDGMTAFRALQMLTGSKNIDLDYSGSGSTAYVKSINGQSAGDKSAQSGWIYKVNGKSPNVSAGSFKLQDGDTLVWMYQE